jgi:hypothetical protein
MGSKVPRSVNARDGGVNGVLQPFRDPIHCKGDESNQASNFGRAAPTTTSAAGRVLSRFVLDIDGDKGNTVPCGESCRDNASEQAHEIDVTIPLRDIDRGRQHQGAERDSGNPRDECKYEKGDKYEEYYAARIVVARQHVDGGDQTKHNVQYASDPDECLWKQSGEPDIGVAEEEGDAQAEDEEYNGVGVEANRLCAIVDAAAVDVASVGCTR